MRARTILLLLVLLALPGRAAPRTPSALVNGADQLAQVGMKGPVSLAWDVRTLGAAGVRILVHRWPLRVADAPADLEWRFERPVGPADVRLGRLPRGIYRVVAVALDAEGREVGAESMPVFVEYGGPRAWEGLDRDVDLRADPPPLAGVGASYVPAEDLPRVDLSPNTAVVKPGRQVQFRAVVRRMPPETEVRWELEGPGDLEVQPDRQALYTAPGDETNQVVRIRCYVPDTGAEEGKATILVTPTRVGSEE